MKKKKNFVNLFLNIDDDDLQTLVKEKEDFIIKVTKRYNIKCTFVRINENNYHSPYLMFTKKPFLSYHLFVLNDTYYLSLVSQDKCVLYQITKLFFLINLLQNFTKIKLLPSDENSHAFLSENEFGLSFKFVSQDQILLIQNCVSRLIQASKMNFNSNYDFKYENCNINYFGESLSQQLKERELISNDSFHCITLEKYLFICLHPLLSYYLQRNYYQSEKFHDNDFRFFDLDPDDNIVCFSPSDFLMLAMISKNIYNYCDMYLGYHYESEILVAVKCYKGRNSRTAYERELEFYRTVKHRNILRCYGYIETRSFVQRRQLILQYMCNDTLRTCIPQLSSNGKSKILIDILYGIDYLHSFGIMHRDIKTDNILLNYDYHAYISDFDSCQSYVVRNFQSNDDNSKSETSSLIYQHEIHSGVGTMRYMSPENYLGAKCSFQSDLYSLGMIVYEMCTEKVPYYDHNIEDIKSLVENGITPYLSFKDYGKIVKIFDICKSLNVSGRSTIFYLIHKVRSSQLFFPECILYELDKQMDLLEKYRYDVSSRRVDVCAIIESAANNELDSIYFYGKMLKNGIIVNNNIPNNKEAFKMFEIAANQNHIESCYQLGKYYYQSYGEGKRDSFQYFKFGALHNHKKSMYYLAKCYLQSIGCKGNIEKGINYLITSSSLNYPKAQSELGVMLFQGELVEQDLDLATYLLSQAGIFYDKRAYSIYWIFLKETQYQNLEDFTAVNALFITNQKIIKSEKNKEDTKCRILAHYQLAYHTNDPISLYIIGRFTFGEYGGGNKIKALHWVQKSASMKLGNALFFLGAIKESENEAEALNIYSEAINNGSHKAIYRMMQKYLNLDQKIIVRK